jgi:hypothetical protein
VCVRVKGKIKSKMTNPRPPNWEKPRVHCFLVISRRTKSD